MMRRLIAVLGLLAIVGCTQIPTSGEVVSIDPSTIVREGEVDFLPPGPSAGATPEEIIQGFIAAGTAAQDNYRVARSYLTLEFRELWNPNSSVLISTGEMSAEEVREGRVELSVPVVASVDDAGRYDSAASATTQVLDFRVSLEAGQWRIVEAPDGIVLSETAFREGFESVRVYYYSADFRELVPDLRWFASRGDVTTKVVRGLLEPPSYWLNQGAVVSAFPAGTQLVLSPVPVVDGQAQVDLTDGVLAADETQRARMLWQLLSTLQQISGISGVAITVNQTPVGIPIGLGEQPVLTSGRDPRPVVVRGRDFGYLQSGRVESIEALESAVVNLRPERVFYQAALQQAALVNTEGLWWIKAGLTPEEPVDIRTGLVRPVIDSCGFLWSMAAEPGDTGNLRVFQSGPGGESIESIPVELALPPDSSVVAFELARDNTRMMLVLQGESGTRVALAAIQRGTDCTPVAIGEFLELSPLPGTAIDAAFVDEHQVAVATVEAGAGEVFVQDVAGRVSSLGRPSGPVALVGGVGGIPGLRMLSDQGLVYQPRGNGWQATGESASVLVTQR